MMTFNPLETVWNTYQITCECLKIAQKTISEKNKDILRRTQFIAVSKEDVQDWIFKCYQEADNFVIVSLWAVFERILVQYVQNEAIQISNTDQIIKRNILQKIEESIEYWRIADILDLFKGTIDSNLLGHVKQIKNYRDWLAHKNIKKGQPTTVLPNTAYRVLSQILFEIEKLRDSDEITSSSV